VARVFDVLRSPFAFLFASTKKEALVAGYVIREHHQGRGLAEILKDAYVTNRLWKTQVERLLDRPDVLHAIGEDMIATHRSGGTGAAPD